MARAFYSSLFFDSGSNPVGDVLEREGGFTLEDLLDVDEVLQEAKIKSASVALVAVRLWVNAMITYHEVLKVVGPKRLIVSEMTAKLEIVMKNLNEKRAIVKAINEKLDKLDKEQKALEAKA